MTRSDLIAALVSRFPNLMAKDAEIAVKEILDAIGESLAQGHRIEIRGFGSFSLIYRPARKRRNPKNGETERVPAKHVPQFKTGKEMRERVELSAEHALIKRSARCARKIISSETYPSVVAPNQLEQQFDVEAPNQG